MRRRGTRVLAGLAAGVLAVGVQVGAAPPVDAAPGSVSAAEAGDEAPADQVAAMRSAHRSGRRVEIVSQRSETGQVFANPDGTVTQEATSRPARVHASDGSWAAVDTSLVTGLNGGLAPVATSSGLRFSGGGDRQLARIWSGSRSLSLTWPTSLPEPVVDADTATYPEVLPGVDLRVSAQVDGFSEVLVVRTRAAADNPDLTTIRMGVAATGVDVSVDGQGRLTAVDSASGAVVFGAPSPVMWDSTPPTQEATGPAAAASDAGGPGVGAHRALVGASLDGDGGLALVPDPAMLADPDTVFPVFVDPTVSSSIYAWTYVDSQFPSETYMTSKNTGGRSDLPAGHYVDDGVGTQRSFVRFNFASSIAGKQVVAAEFRAYCHYQWYSDATDEPIHALSVHAPTHSTSWNNQPEVYVGLGQQQVKRGEWGGWGAITATQQAADAGRSWMAVELKSDDEGDYRARETFSVSGSTQPKLVVTVNTTPRTPSGLKLSPCYTACASPAVTSSLQATLSAKVSDPDGGNLKQVKIEVWSADYSTRVDHTYASLTNIRSGTTVAWMQDLPRARGKQYHFKVQACDRWVCSAWSGWFTFTTDTTDPTLPAVASDDYPAFDAAQQGPYSGGVGVAGDFTLSSPSTDVTTFLWSLNASPPGTALPATDGTAVLHTAPTTDGPQQLFVQSVDAAGNRSEITAYQFAVKPSPATAGDWPLDDGSGTTAVDVTDAGHPLTLHGGVSWQPGHVGTGAVQLDGSSGYLSTDVSVVDTTGSFSVAAWVYLDADTGFETAVAQDGVTSSAFYLQYRPADVSCGCWSMTMRTDDGSVDDAPTVKAISTTDPPHFQEWTHLVGIYDAVNQQLRLYVNGVLQATPTPFIQPFGSAGPLRVGQALTDGATADHWTGQIDQVSIYQRILSDDEIERLASAGA